MTTQALDTTGENLQKSLNLSDVASAATSAHNLGLGTADSPAFTGENLSGLTASKVVVTDASKNLASGTNSDAQIAAAVTASHAAVTVSAPISVTGQALSLVNNAGSPATVTAIDVGALATSSDTVVPTSKAVATYAGTAVADAHAAVTLSATLGSNLLGLSTQQLTLNTQTANYVFAGPTSGVAAAPAFRAMVNADLPSGLSPSITGLNLSGLTASEPIVTDGSKNLASVTYATFKGSLSIAQADVAGLTTGSSPTFAGLNLLGSGNVALSGQSSGTGAVYGQLYNTTNYVIIGVENASGGALLTGTTAYAIVLESIAEYPIYFGVNNSIKMTISATGRVGIGTTSPGSKLSVVGLPTSTDGLSAGDIWNNGGVLCIV